MSSSDNSTQRFSDRVSDYVKYRPTYPDDLVQFIYSEFRLTGNSIIADIGSGTGISSELFLKKGNSVYAVEPNDSMREAAEKNLKEYTQFHSVKGTSEETTLPDHSVNLIVAAQAFHWFEPEKTKTEFKRILKPNGFVALIWNDRKTSGSAFAAEYENLIIKFATDYQKVKHRNISPEKIESFLGEFQSKTFYNSQTFNFQGLLGRLASSSYAPNRLHPNYPAMCEALKNLFEKHQTDGAVKIEYETQIFFSVW